MSGIQDQVLKEQMNDRLYPDSCEFTMGSAAKGTAVKAKVYFDALDEDTMNKKVANLLRIRQLMVEKGVA